MAVIGFITEYLSAGRHLEPLDGAASALHLGHLAFPPEKLMSDKTRDIMILLTGLALLPLYRSGEKNYSSSSSSITSSTSSIPTKASFSSMAIFGFTEEGVGEEFATRKALINRPCF